MCVMCVCVVEQKKYNFSHYPLAVSILLTKYISDFTSLGSTVLCCSRLTQFPPNSLLLAYFNNRQPQSHPYLLCNQKQTTGNRSMEFN